jgi:hypothetical protein
MLPTKATGTTLGTALRLTAFWFLAHGAAPESNRPSVGLPRLTDFEGLRSERRLATEAGFRLRFRAIRCG